MPHTIDFCTDMYVHLGIFRKIGCYLCLLFLHGTYLYIYLLDIHDSQTDIKLARTTNAQKVR